MKESKEEALRRLGQEDARHGFIPAVPSAEIAGDLVRFPAVPGAPVELYGAMLRVTILDHDQVVERYAQPLERSKALLLSENRIQVEGALEKEMQRLSSIRADEP